MKRVMKRFVAGWLLCACLDVRANPGPAFGAPVLPSNPAAACASAGMSITHAPDGSAISLLRHDGRLLQTAGKATTTIHCSIGLLVTSPRAVAVLQVDLRGAEHKLAGSELELDIKVGSGRHRARFGAGQLLDGSPTLRRFHVTGLPTTADKVAGHPSPGTQSRWHGCGAGRSRFNRCVLRRRRRGGWLHICGATAGPGAD